MSRARYCLADWHAVMESSPLTDNQLGRIGAECERLGLADRAERLAVTAQLAGLAELGTTRQLSQAQAGRVVRLLAEARELADLGLELAPALPPPPSRPVMTWADVMRALADAMRSLSLPGLGLAGSGPANGLT